MAAHGVGNDTKVVLYAASPRPGVDFGPMWCTRAWWVMHHFGVDCAVLNGGFEKWIAEGWPISTEPTTPPSAHFVAKSDGREAIATKDDVSAAQAGSGECVVDALSAASYAGADKAVYGPRKGHITGAISAPMYDVLSGEGMTFADGDTLSARFAERGLSTDQPVITYCGGGIAATVDAFALKLIGNDRVRVYDGSLMEWSADESLPMTDPSAAGGN
jgi:thiosulfate/3-mercaptopyruvate sulfurtransferase